MKTLSKIESQVRTKWLGKCIELRVRTNTAVLRPFVRDKLTGVG